MELAF